MCMNSRALGSAQTKSRNGREALFQRMLTFGINSTKAFGGDRGSGMNVSCLVLTSLIRQGGRLLRSLIELLSSSGGERGRHPERDIGSSGLKTKSAMSKAWERHEQSLGINVERLESRPFMAVLCATQMSFILSTGVSDVLLYQYCIGSRKTTQKSGSLSSASCSWSPLLPPLSSCASPERRRSRRSGYNCNHQSDEHHLTDLVSVIACYFLQACAPFRHHLAMKSRGQITRRQDV